MDDAPAPEADLSALAASLQSDARDQAVFFRVLCSTLETALPHNTTVEREHSVFKAKRLARKVTVSLGPDTFEAEESGGSVLCRHVHLASGIGSGLPFSHPLSVAEWIQALLGRLAQEATTDSAAADALRSLST